MAHNLNPSAKETLFTNCLQIISQNLCKTIYIGIVQPDAEVSNFTGQVWIERLN